MKVEIYDHLDKKGLGNNDLFEVIPVGKKGTSYSVEVERGKVIFQFNANIRDSELKVAIALLSHTFNQVGKDTIDKFRSGDQLPMMNEQTGQALYAEPVTVDAKELSELIYGGDRKKGKRVFTHLQHLEDLTLRYEFVDLSCTIRLFDNVAYRNGKITFNIANMLLNRLGSTLIAFRLPPVLAHSGLTMRLSMYVESHQRPGSTYKKEGKTHTKFYPKNEYYLDDLRAGLRMENLQESKIIANLKISFEELNKKERSNFPKFTYNEKRRSFENEYKNGNN